jgi:predicted TIM-barrel fold metal-dependent hydrolase
VNTTQTRRVVDVQTHFLPPTMVSALERRTEVPRVVVNDSRRMVHYADSRAAAYPLLDEMVDLDRKLQAMDAGGIDVSVLSVNIPGIDCFDADEAPSIARAVNDELADLVASHKDRLEAFAALPMQVPEAAATELTRAVGAGLRGAMLYSNVAGRSLDEPAFRVVFSAAAEADAPLLIHPTYPLSAATLDVYALIPVVGFMFDTSTAILRLVLDGLFERHADLKVIMGHVGGVVPYLLGRIDYESSRIPGGLGSLTVAPSEHLRKLYVDTVSAWPPALNLAIDVLGIDKILFASDHPFWDPQRTHEALAALGLGAEEMGAIHSGNAVRLLGLN